MSVTTAFRKFLSWETTKMVDCHVCGERTSVRALGVAVGVAMLRGAEQRPAGSSPATGWL